MGSLMSADAQSATPRRDYVITDDGAETRAYRVPTNDDPLTRFERRSVAGGDRRAASDHRPLDDRDRRERVRRALDRMQARPAAISRIAAADRRDQYVALLDQPAGLGR